MAQPTTQPTSAAAATGTMPFGDYRTWYKVTGDLASGGPALVIAHGGPGSTHDYLNSMAGLADHGRPVVHYDQLGNGGSSHLPGRPAGFWSVELFLDELDNLLTGLGVQNDYVLFGQSWGGMLVASHAKRQPPGLRGLVIANAPASYSLWASEMEVLRAALPAGVNETLLRHEAAGTTASPEYLAAMNVFYGRHVCRLPTWPPDLMATFMEIYNDPTVYHTMNGPSEFHVVGSLRGWSVIDGLDNIAVPTLLISGRHDEATPVTVQPYADLIPGARWRIFEDSSHSPHLEEPELFMQTMTEFLNSLS